MKFTLFVTIAAVVFAVAHSQACEPTAGAPCADGANRKKEPRACDIDWSYRNGDAVKDADADGCLSITDFPPFGSDSPDLAAPQDSRTNVERWCSFKQNKAIEQGETSNRIHDLKNSLTSWGYCLSIEGTTDNSTTPAPSTDGSGSSTAPTPLVVPDAPFVADGGFQATPFPCDASWTYVDDKGAESKVFDGCASMDEYPPVGLPEELVDPRDSRTNTSKWCSVKQGLLGTGNSKYDVNPGTGFVEKTQAWGFCLDTSIVAATGTPSTPPETLPTLSPVAEPNPTASPVATPSAGNTSTTQQPTTPTSTPTELATTLQPSMGAGEGSGGNSTEAPNQGLSSGEIAAAVIVPLIVVFGAIGGFAFYKYQSLSAAGAGAGAGAGYAEAGTGEPETAKAQQDTGKPVTESEGKGNADEILLG